MAHRAMWMVLVAALVASTAVAQEEGPPPVEEQPPPVQYQQPGYPYPPPPPQYLPPPPPQRPPRPKQRAFDLALIGTGSLGVTDPALGYTASFRAELDISRVGIELAFNHFDAPAWASSAVNGMTGLVGYSLYSGPKGRVRVLAGADVAVVPSVVQIGPTFGVNTRLGMGLFGLDAAAMVTPFPFRMFEARAAGVLKLLILEVHLGWRFQALDASSTGSFRTFLQAPSVNGPYIGVGIRI